MTEASATAISARNDQSRSTKRCLGGAGGWSGGSTCVEAGSGSGGGTGRDSGGTSVTHSWCAANLCLSCV